MSGAIRDSQSGNFATSRRGGLTPDEIRMAFELKAKGRSVQHVAAYLGRSSQDVSALFSSAAAAQTVTQKIIAAPPQPKTGGQSKQFTPEQLTILKRVDNGLQSGRSAAKEIGCSCFAVRTWVANNRMRRDIRPSRSTFLRSPKVMA